MKSSFSASLGPTSKQLGDPTAAVEYGNRRKANWQRSLIKPGLVRLVPWPPKQDLGIYGVEPGRGWDGNLDKLGAMTERGGTGPTGSLRVSKLGRRRQYGGQQLAFLPEEANKDHL